VMADEMKLIPSWTDKVKYLFKKPGWFPESLGGYRSAPEVDKNTYQKYDTSYPIQLNYYVLFQYILCLGVTGLFLFKQSEFTITEKAVIAILISSWVVNCGVLFESKRWVVVSEWIRIVSFSLLAMVATYWVGLPTYCYSIALIYGLVSGVWFKSVSNLKNEKRVVV
jgi:alkylglycerol monooxygenase